MSQKSTEINKNDISDDVREKAEHDAILHGDAYVFISTLRDIIEKYGIEEYHKYLTDGKMPEEVNI